MRSNKAAQMAESVDALVSNTSGATRAGSTPALGTKPESSSEGSGFFFVSFVRTIGAKAHGGEQWGRALPSSHVRLLRPLWGRRLNRRALHGFWAERTPTIANPTFSERFFLKTPCLSRFFDKIAQNLCIRSLSLNSLSSLYRLLPTLYTTSTTPFNLTSSRK